MTGRTYCALLSGINVHTVEVEADVSMGIPAFELTGNLSGTVREAKDRIKAAIRNSGVMLKPSKITVNLAPSNLRKEGTHFDLAIVIAVMLATNYINNEEISNMMFIGELGLDGRVNPVKAVLPIIAHCKSVGITKCIVPKQNVNEGRYITGIDVIGVESLSECINYIKGRINIRPVAKEQLREEICSYDMDYSDIRGQEGLKRAMLIAAGAMHNILMVGPPGAGKTMAASGLITIMPPLNLAQCIEISKIYSIAGLLNEENYFITKRPFRAPGYTITPAAMAGGGIKPIPGEMSLAEYGVLFLDELNLFSPEVIETLRVPLEKGRIRINRSGGTYEFPAGFMLVAAINPCKCGYYPDRTKCNCTQQEIKKHLGKISRPLMDRIDICVQAPKVQFEDMENISDNSEYSGDKMRKKVLRIYEIQQERFRNCSFNLNSQIPANQIPYFCQMENDAKTLIKTVYDKYDLTARGYHKIMKVARTVADLEGHDKIMLPDLSEAIGYRMSDNRY